jgi:hypothetical protein
MFLAGNVIETVLVFVAFAVSIRPVLMRAAVVGRMRQCAIPLQPRLRPQADSWRAGGGVARTV